MFLILYCCCCWRLYDRGLMFWISNKHRFKTQHDEFFIPTQTVIIFELIDITLSWLVLLFDNGFDFCCDIVAAVRSTHSFQCMYWYVNWDNQVVAIPKWWMQRLIFLKKSTPLSHNSIYVCLQYHPLFWRATTLNFDSGSHRRNENGYDSVINDDFRDFPIWFLRFYLCCFPICFGSVRNDMPLDVNRIKSLPTKNTDSESVLLYNHRNHCRNHRNHCRNHRYHHNHDQLNHSCRINDTIY